MFLLVEMGSGILQVDSTFLNQKYLLIRLQRFFWATFIFLGPKFKPTFYFFFLFFNYYLEKEMDMCKMDSASSNGHSSLTFSS